MPWPDRPPLTLTLARPVGAAKRFTYLLYLITTIEVAKTARARCRWSALSAVACEVM